MALKFDYFSDLDIDIVPGTPLAKSGQRALAVV
jgi:hypothetical protein